MRLVEGIVSIPKRNYIQVNVLLLARTGPVLISFRNVVAVGELGAA
jgi:hypothetical protein